MSVSCEKSSDDLDNDCDGKPCSQLIDSQDNDCDGGDCDDVKPDDDANNNTKAAIPTIGTIDGDWDIDIAQRGLIEISGCDGPVFIDCQWVPCDPVATVIVECKYPNGFCQTITVSGGGSNTGGGTSTGSDGQLQTIQYEIALPGGGTATTVNKPTLPIKKAQGAILRINLPEGSGVVDQENLLDQLKNEQFPRGTNIEDVAKSITNNFNIKEDSPISENLVADFQKNNPKLKIKTITVLKGEYPITKTKDIPNGYIDALITVKADGHVTVLK